MTKDRRELRNRAGEQKQEDSPQESAAESIVRQGAEHKPATFYQLFYATSGVLTCIAILVIAGLAMQIQERDQLKHLLNEQERLVSSLQQVYIVEAGETIDSICMEVYGTTERSEAVRLLNSLEAGEEPEAGQKIFLP